MVTSLCRSCRFSRPAFDAIMLKQIIFWTPHAFNWSITALRVPAKTLNQQLLQLYIAFEKKCSQTDTCGNHWLQDNSNWQKYAYVGKHHVAMRSK
jgi:hypothetical protein